MAWLWQGRLALAVQPNTVILSVAWCCAVYFDTFSHSDDQTLQAWLGIGACLPQSAPEAGLLPASKLWL